MGFWELAAGGALYALAKKAQANAAEERRRRATPCKFRDGISSSEFNRIARKSAKYIKRIINLSIDGPVVSGTVRSQSGTSEWDFSIDFNDYGHITGKYWLSTDNHDSNIPAKLAENISSMIKAYPEDILPKKIETYREQKQAERIIKQKEEERQYKINKKKANSKRNASIIRLIIIVAAIAWMIYCFYTLP